MQPLHIKTQKTIMDLRKLKHLVALSEEKNFGRAANRVHLSQPAFSRSIQSAEETVGMQLFNRNNNEIITTPAGDFIIERAKKILFENRSLERDLELFKNRQLGDIAFGFGPFPASTFLKQILLKIHLNHPKVNIQAEINNWKYLLEHLRNEELDFFVCDTRDIPNYSDISIKPFEKFNTGFFIKTDHPLATQLSQPASVLKTYGLATVTLPKKVKEVLHKVLKLNSDEKIPLMIECDDLRTLKHMALNTHLIVGLSSADAIEDLRSGQLLQLQLSDIANFVVDLGIVTLKGHSLSPISKLAIQYLRDIANEQID